MPCFAGWCQGSCVHEPPGSQLNSKKQNHESLELMFVNLAGEQAQLDGIDPKISVTQLKQRLEGAEPWIPPAPSQKLIWGDVILSKGEASLSELGIPNKSTIHVHREVVEIQKRTSKLCISEVVYQRTSKPGEEE
eukprot:gnl/MRDRNA2_/MRDRNA2_17947_c0_seq1.p1 gnl/MRDRNA2_/MRDRNA2_17947_c0~~gnl/MRDRNA2_/MRDRNA2_17947_c0_seq1.p1  ORF type:complete len:135 (-),score=27.26 gnl/MRDRNA2_/MRDRNA2_17947_c0_seq1:293-697(-)